MKQAGEVLVIVVLAGVLFVFVDFRAGFAMLIIGLVAFLLASAFRKNPKCAGCGAKLGKQHKDHCHRRGLVTEASVDEVRESPDAVQRF